MVDIFQYVLDTLESAVNEYADSSQGKLDLGNRTVKVAPSYQNSTTDFPNITIEEKTNVFADSELDSREKFSKIMYEVNIYDTSVNKLFVARTLAKICNETLTNLGFKRIYNEPMPNTADATIYRIVQRFDGYIDNDNGVVYKKMKF